MNFVFRLMELAAAESQNNDQDMEEDDDADYYRQEVGAEPEKGTAKNICSLCEDVSHHKNRNILTKT